MNHNEYITTGFPTLDEAVGGFRPAELAIIGGRPAMGKSSMMISMELNMAKHHKISLAVFSLEMPATTMVRRMIKDMQDPYAEMPDFFLDDTPSLSIIALREKCSQLQRSADTTLVGEFSGIGIGRPASGKQDTVHLSSGILLCRRRL